MGVSPVQWNSWETVGVSMDLGLSNNQQTFQNASGNGNNAAVQGLLSGINVGNQQILDPSDSVVNNITASGEFLLVNKEQEHKELLLKNRYCIFGK